MSVGFIRQLSPNCSPLPTIPQDRAESQCSPTYGIPPQLTVQVPCGASEPAGSEMNPQNVWEAKPLYLGHVGLGVE